MPEAVEDREALLGRIVTLVGTGVIEPKLAAQKLGHLDENLLASMADQLQAGAEKAATARKKTSGAEARRKNLDARREEALRKLEGAADQIRARREARAQETQKAEAVIKAAFGVSYTQALPQSIALMSAMNAVQQDLLHSGMDDFKAVGLAHGIFEHLQVKTSILGAFDDALHRTAVQAYLNHAVLKSRFDVIRLINNDAHGSLPKHDKFQRFLQIATMRTAAFDPTFIPDLRPSLNPAIAAESLAKLLVFAKDFKATHIIALGVGGNIIGQFLTNELRHSTYKPFYHHVTRPKTEHYWPRIFGESKEADNILVVTDFAADAEPFQRFREAFEHGTRDNTAIVALGARADVYEDLMASGGLTYCTQLVVDDALTLPWTRSGGYQRTESDHVFGHDGRKPFRIALDFMASIAENLRTKMRA